MDRRQLLKAGLALPFAGAAPAFAGDRLAIADMHFHLFFPGQLPGRNTAMKPLRRTMSEGNVSLLAWSIVGDLPWLRPTPRGIRQSGMPEPGSAKTWFEEQIGRVKAHLSEQGLALALTPHDIDRALLGEPRVVLSVEGATFLDEDPKLLGWAYEQGVRHIQLVHYIRNDIGDFQTEKPDHNGLTEMGSTIVKECNRLGILIDLAHATDTVVNQVLDLSSVPVVWSHSSIARNGKPNWMLPAVQARQLDLKTARAIAGKGGVIGLWALRSDAGPDVAGYAKRLAEMAEMLGEDHAAFGTDMNALASPVIADYRDLQRVLSIWHASGMNHSRIEKLAIGNYARVLKAALGARTA